MKPAAVHSDIAFGPADIMTPSERLAGVAHRAPSRHFFRAVLAALALHGAALGWTALRADRADTPDLAERPVADLVFEPPPALEPAPALPAPVVAVAGGDPAAATPLPGPSDAAPDIALEPGPADDATPVSPEPATASAEPVAPPPADISPEPAPAHDEASVPPVADAASAPAPVARPAAPARHAAPRAAARRAPVPAPHAAAGPRPVAESSAPAEPTQTAPARPVAEVMASLESSIRGAVQAAVRFPPAAQMMGLTGRAQVFLEYRAGTVGNLSVTHSAGTPLFDEAALHAVRSAAYPKPPPEIGDRLLRLLVWVEFRHQG